MKYTKTLMLSIAISLEALSAGTANAQAPAGASPKYEAAPAIAVFVSHPQYCSYFLGQEKGEDMSGAYGVAMSNAIGDHQISVVTQLATLEKACRQKT